jgi:hypothetical protein
MAPHARSPAQFQPAPERQPLFNTSELQQLSLRDELGQVAELVALPLGWEITNEISWNDQTGCVGNMMRRSWSMIAPDSLTVISVLPGFGWQLAGTQIATDPCPVGEFRSLRQVLEATAQQTHPGARIYDYEDLTAQYQAKLAEAGFQQSGGVAGQTSSVEAGRLLIGYQQDGIEMREVLASMLTVTRLHGHVLMSVSGISSIRGPAGPLDLASMSRIVEAGKPDLQWLAYYRQRAERNMQRFFAGQTQRINDWHQRQMAIINARGAADRHAIRMRTNQEVASIYGAIASSNSASSDRTHRRTLEGIGEYNTFAGIGGTTVQSSIHGGNHVYQDSSNPSNVFSTNRPAGQAPAGYIELERLP